MKKSTNIKGMLKAYLRWPIFLIFLLICMNLSVYVINREAGILITFYVILYMLIVLILYYFNQSQVVEGLVHYAIDYAQVQKQLLKELALPYAIIDTNGKLLWGNDEFLEIVVDERAAKKSISNIFPQIGQDCMPSIEEDKEIHVEYRGSNYKVILRMIAINSRLENEIPVSEVDKMQVAEQNRMVAMYLYDETEIIRYMRENQEQKLIVSLLYIDNYEEALESIDEVRRSLLIALIDRKINKYMQSIDAIIKKLEKDKYIIVFKYKYLAGLQTNKFSLLDEVRTVNIGNEMAVTLSMGIGVNEESYIRGYECARAAIDLALGRGGDQAVIKDGDKISYYGGKSVQVEKNTRVKARVKAHALKELVEAKESVVIMGHSIGDVDSLGAAIGIYRIAKTLNKKANIVFNEITTSVRPMINRFIQNSDYEEDLFLKSSAAIEKVNNNTLLVVVDVNRPSYTECKELLERTKTIVILDHHRQTGEAISNAVLSYVEPYASSTCEMVAEILQYIGEDLRLRQAEADVMYSGIMIDTDNFLTKTGVRTFEAAAYLRRNGADITRIRKAFRGIMVESKAKAEAISKMELFMGSYGIAVSQSEGIDSPTVLNAQVANELLDISEIKASFVFTQFNHKIYISARSIDELNVQVVMEKLGGGGHMSVAGAQLADHTIEEAIQLLKQTLEMMHQEGEL